MMTIPCALPRSGNSLLELSKQHFIDQPVDYTLVTVNAENDNLPVHFINHSDHEVVIPKHSYVRPWRKSKNHTKMHYPPSLPMNQLVSMPYPSALLTVTSYPK